MFNSKNHISIDKSGKEISPTRTPFFPISVNNGDIHQYIGSWKSLSFSLEASR